MKAIEKAIAHFQSIEARQLYIPEWDVTVYCKPCTLAQKAKWFTQANGDNYQLMLHAIVDGAIDEHGEKLFDASDRPKLNLVVGEVVERIGLFVLGTAGDSDEEREKN